MNRKFRGRFPHRGGKRPFHSMRKDFPLKDKTHSHYKKTSGGQRNLKNEIMNRLKETDVGITEYVSEHKGFSGVIKQRYADFHVNEIDCDGKIVTLTTTLPPEIKVEHIDGKPDAEEHLKSVVSLEILEKIRALINQNEGSRDEIEIEVTEMTKDDRRKLHLAIQGIGPGKLVSNTKQKEEKKFIVVCRHNAKVRSDRRSEWPSSYGGDYVHFVLFKENLDTMETVNLIASKLRIKPNMVTYAGNKDRRGITSQMMSIWHVDPKRLTNLNSELRGVTLGNYAFKKTNLKLGDLHGNRFRIVLRNVTGSDEQIQQAVSSLSDKGFLNYYGLQRFGSSISVPTHVVGKALLQGNWKLAVELILKPREEEQNPALANARKVWWTTRNATSAFKELPNKEKLIEGRLLIGLSQCASNDFLSALEKIPRNTRLLYLHSYQSLIWNKVVSKRIRELGLKPLSGDLVFVNGAEADVSSGDEDESESGDKLEKKKSQVRVISEKDLDTVSIHDIVMPLPGHDVMYPQNVMKEWYEDLLKLDGLSSASLKQSVRKYSVSGTYRKIVICPEKLSWKTLRYSEPETTLELSDVEKMKNVKPPKDNLDGAYKALILDFCLPPSTYATMALREILKSDTSSQHQASLNDYHIQKTNETPSGSSEEPVSKSNVSASGEDSKATICDSNNKIIESSDEVSQKTISDDKINNEETEINELVTEKSCEIEGKEKVVGHKRIGDNLSGEVEEKKIKLDIE